MHGVGATLYYDGANLNAVMGLSRPGDMGFDIVHFNLHKSFTQPHGGGGPGSGPIAVSDRIAPFLPVPVVAARRGRHVRPRPRSAGAAGSKSIGRLRGFHGNYGCFVRAYAYICSLGGDGLKDASETAVLNANYLLARLKEHGVAEYLPLAYGELCMHEFVLSGGPMKRELQIKTLDLAKRLLDFGFHPPTVYFPLLVDEALMVEPTETETRETLDAFADAIAAILKEAAEDPEIARGAPYSTPGAPPRRGRRRQAPGHPRGAGVGRARMAIEHRKLGSTGVSVSPLCLGAMMFGAWGNTDHEDSIRIIHRALDAGINFIDTADVYSRGESEEIVGKALAGGRRDSVVLATKVHGTMGDEDAQPIRQLAPLDRQGGREQPAPARHRLDRPLPDPPPRAGHRHRRDARRAQRPRARGQGPLHRQLDVPRPPDRRGAVGRREARSRALRVRAAALLDAHPADRGRRAARVRAVRDGRDPVEPARRRLAVG